MQTSLDHKKIDRTIFRGLVTVVLIFVSHLIIPIAAHRFDAKPSRLVEGVLGGLIILLVLVLPSFFGKRRCD